MKEPKEIFLPVHDPWFGKSGGYSVSNLGIIKNRLGHPLKPRRTPQGYYQVCLYRFGKRKIFLVHRLVAYAHIGPPNHYRDEVNHKNKDRGNNCADNLEWVTPSENVKHAYAYGNHGKKKLTDVQEAEIFELLRQRISGQKIADKFGCSRMSISRYRKRLGAIKG